MVPVSLSPIDNDEAAQTTDAVLRSRWISLAMLTLLQVFVGDIVHANHRSSRHLARRRQET
jgi:hypothetical protein